MKIYKKTHLNILYLVYRLVKPLIDPIHLYQGITGYFWFIRDVFRYKNLDPNASILNSHLFPILDEKVSFTPFDAQYFFQQIWVFKHVLKAKPKAHVDVASTYELSGYLSTIVPTTFIDLRPIKSQLENLTIKQGNILNLPYKDDSIESLSCLHVVEHIGLGRYGDVLDPQGTEKACRELSRVLGKGGRLYFSTPIGQDRICFNAHHIRTPQTVLQYFENLTLLSFSVVDDDGNFIQKADPQDYQSAMYSSGMFVFTK